MLTNDVLKRVLGYEPSSDVFAALQKACDLAQINTPERLACFLAQTAHESNSFKTLEENLNYGKDGLLKIFPKYFNAQTAAQCERKPEAIANIVYANRMGNGAPSTGDGYRYRGRGVIQLTGKSNYEAAGKFIGLNLVQNPDKVATMPAAFLTAAWFWSSNGLNSFADKGDFIGLTKRINGGTIGIEHRTELYAKALSALGVRK